MGPKAVSLQEICPSSAPQTNSLFDEDRSRWDATLIAEGQMLLDFSAKGPELTEYHVDRV
jgi:predicted RNA polymerase sigma factor